MLWILSRPLFLKQIVNQLEKTSLREVMGRWKWRCARNFVPDDRQLKIDPTTASNRVIQPFYEDINVQTTYSSLCNSYFY